MHRFVTLAALVVVGCGSDGSADGSETPDAASTGEVEVDTAHDTTSELEHDTAPDAATSELEHDTIETSDATSELEHDTIETSDATSELEHDTIETSDVAQAEVVADPCAQELPPPAPRATDPSAIAPTEPGRVRAIWLSPADRPFPPGLHERLDAWMKLARRFFADELLRWSGLAESFVPQLGPDGRWDVIYLQGESPLAHYHAHPTSPDAPGEALAEIFRRLPPEIHRDAILVYFYDTASGDGATLAHTGQAGSAAPWQGEHAGYALIGAHVLGVGFDTVRLDPAAQRCVFDDTHPSGLEDYDGHGTWRALDRGEWASTFVGASIHELGHAFGLAHVFDDADGDGIENNLMGNGFRRFGGRFSARLPQPPTLLGPTSASALAAHPYLDAAPPERP